LNIQSIINNFESLILDQSCFYGKDQVQLVNGEKRSIEYLKVGDRVWSISPDGSALIEDEIVMMMQNEPNASGYHI
jgi:hypothetical protein